MSDFTARLQLAVQGRPVDAVAREAGVARMTLRRALKGALKRGMYFDTLSSIARACGVKPVWLASGEGPMREEEAV